MSKLPKNIAEHFRPFYKMLADLKVAADEAYVEGGMTWSVDFSQREPDLARADKGSFFIGSKFDANAKVCKYKHLMVRLMWQTFGSIGKFDNITDNVDWSEEEWRCTTERGF